jgi:hypothetical protein
VANFPSAVIIGLALALIGSAIASAQKALVVAVPAKVEAVNGTTENSDAFIWHLFTPILAPTFRSSTPRVAFELWASDDDTFSQTPPWPSPNDPIKLHASVLESIKRMEPGVFDSMIKEHTGPIDVQCNAPGNPAVGGFPTSGTPPPCIPEQTNRNFPMFDYIIRDKLNTRSDLKAAFANSFKVVRAFPIKIAYQGVEEVNAEQCNEQNNAGTETKQREPANSTSYPFSLLLTPFVTPPEMFCARLARRQS